MMVVGVIVSVALFWAALIGVASIMDEWENR